MGTWIPHEKEKVLSSNLTDIEVLTVYSNLNDLGANLVCVFLDPASLRGLNKNDREREKKHKRGGGLKSFI